MRDVAHQLTPQPFRLGQLRGHRVERTRQLRDLIRPVRIHADIQIARLHPPRRLGQRADRAQDAAREPEDEHDCQQAGHRRRLEPGWHRGRAPPAGIGEHEQARRFAIDPDGKRRHRRKRDARIVGQRQAERRSAHLVVRGADLRFGEARVRRGDHASAVVGQEESAARAPPEFLERLCGRARTVTFECCAHRGDRCLEPLLARGGVGSGADFEQRGASRQDCRQPHRHREDDGDGKRKTGPQANRHPGPACSRHRIP